MSFYNLPHPWDPGYVIPKSVMSEPPERGVFVTEWMPRGTIPTLVPDYLGKPGEKILGRADADLGSLSGSCLGGSSLAGSTLAGHTLRGHSLGAVEWQLTPTGLGGTGRADYAAYGQKAASKMIASVKRLPVAQRSDALTAAMQRLDTTLPARCQKYTNEAAARGLGPAKALQAGLGRAITEGLLGELAKTGRSRSAPHPGSLLGMGCTRARSALGADATYVVSSGKGITPSSGGVYTAPATSCPNPPVGFTWVAATATVPGHWARPRVGETPQPAPFALVPPNCTIETRTSTTPAPTTPPPSSTAAIQVGPFVLPDSVGAKISLHGGTITPAIVNAMSSALAKATAAFLATTTTRIASDFDSTAISKMFPGGGSGQIARIFVNGTVPLFRFKHPKTGDIMGLTIGNLGTPDAPGFSVTYVKFNPSALGKLVDGITELIAKIIDVVKDAVDAVVDLTCDLINTPGAAQGAAAGNPAAGAGVVIAQQTICGGGGPSLPPPPPPASGPNYLLPLAIGGGVLLLVAAAASRRR
jgi:hypothetical protein